MRLVAVDLPSGRKALQTYELELVVARPAEAVARRRLLGESAWFIERGATRGAAIVLPAGTRIRFVTSQPLSMPAMD